MEEIGRGVFATVHLEPSSTGRAHAIKVYTNSVTAPQHVPSKDANDSRQMHELHLKNELKMAGKLRHANIIAPMQVRIGALRTELTMEYAPHGTLEAYAKRFGRGGVPEAEARRLYAQVLHALAYLHGEKSVAHRDVKLENMVLDEQWNARLIDFGSAEEVGPGGQPKAGNGTLSGVSTLQGSPGYMAPEALSTAIAGQGRFDLLAVDMWAAGVALYSLLSEAQLPFTGRDARDLLANVQGRDPPRLSCRMAEPLMRALLTKAPEGRPSARAALRHEWLMAGAPPPSPGRAAMAVANAVRGQHEMSEAKVAAMRAASAAADLQQAATLAKAAYGRGQQANMDAARTAAAAYGQLLQQQQPRDPIQSVDHRGVLVRGPASATGAASSSRPSTAASRPRDAVRYGTGAAWTGGTPWRANLPAARPQTAAAQEAPEFCASLSLRGWASLGM